MSIKEKLVQLFKKKPKKSKKGEVFSKKDEEKIKKRLQALGYLD